MKRYGRIILFDGLAALCFIGVILFGWLPGPGGIPLFLAGLALLAANHTWAERWLETAKVKGKSFKSILFPNKPWVCNLYDVGAIVLFLYATYLLFTTNNRLLATVSVGIVCFSVFVFLINRNRLDKLSSYIRSKKHNHIK